MDIGIMVALIAAGSAVVVAFISFITSVFTNKASVKAIKDVALMKRYFERFDSAKGIADKEFQDSLEALNASCAAIQGLKDETQMFVLRSSTDLDLQELIQRLRKEALNLRDVFKEKHVYLNDYEKASFHEIKNLTNNVFIIINYIKHSKEEERILEKPTNDLAKIRNRLTHAQELLRKSRTDRLIQRINYK